MGEISLILQASKSMKILMWFLGGLFMVFIFLVCVAFEGVAKLFVFFVYFLE